MGGPTRSTRRQGVTAIAVVTVAMMVATAAPAVAGGTPPKPRPDKHVVAELQSIEHSLERAEDVTWAPPATPARLHELTSVAHDAGRTYDKHFEQPCLTVALVQTLVDRIDALVGDIQRAEAAVARGHGGHGPTAKLLWILRHVRPHAAAVRLRLIEALPVGQACGSPNSIDVDLGLEPRHDDVPGSEEGTTKPVATLVDQHGNQADFVEDEIIVHTGDEAALDGFLRRWGGTKLMTADGPGVPGWVPMHLVRIDTGRADAATLSADLGRLTEVTGSDLRVSSADGVRLLAATAEAAIDGLAVAPNWIPDSNSYASRSTSEAAEGPLGWTADRFWSRNAYDWLHLKSGSEQDIGVTEAWTLLDQTRRLGNKVDIAFIDSGFNQEIDPDLPQDRVAYTPLPWGSPFGSRHGYHGTMVTSAAMAIPDNRLGAAGPAGPVAGYVGAYYDGGTWFATWQSMGAAAKDGFKIINMSLGNRIPALLSWTMLPYSAQSTLIRSHGVLLVGGAGNDGKDVDATDCFVVCWEAAFWTVCELARMLCVGGLGHDSLGRDKFSNFGAEDVDIYAPFHTLVGPTPEEPGPVNAVAGTSFSSPYVAGVAALLKAANPAISANNLESRLLNTAFRPTGPGRGIRVVRALSALRAELPPVVVIRSPTEGTSRSTQRPIRFEASIYEDGLGTPEVAWTLADGTVVGTGASFERGSLPLGRQRVTATARFDNGVVAADSVNVTFTNQTPTVTIVSPRDPAGGIPKILRDQFVAFHATTSDPDVSNGPVPDNGVQWYFDEAQEPFAVGHSVQATPDENAELGNHRVTVRACDPYTCVEDSIVVEVVEESVNLPPTVLITNPVTGSELHANGQDAIGAYHELTLRADVADTDGGPVEVVWTDEFSDFPPERLGTGPNLVARLRATCTRFGHRLTVTATDSAGLTSTDSVNVAVLVNC